MENDLRYHREEYAFLFPGELYYIIIIRWDQWGDTLRRNELLDGGLSGGLFRLTRGLAVIVGLSARKTTALSQKSQRRDRKCRRHAGISRRLYRKRRRWARKSYHRGRKRGTGTAGKSPSQESLMSSLIKIAKVRADREKRRRRAGKGCAEPVKVGVIRRLSGQEKVDADSEKFDAKPKKWTLS